MPLDRRRFLQLTAAGMVASVVSRRTVAHPMVSRKGCRRSEVGSESGTGEPLDGSPRRVTDDRQRP